MDLGEANPDEPDAFVVASGLPPEILFVEIVEKNLKNSQRTFTLLSVLIVVQVLALFYTQYKPLKQLAQGYILQK